MSASTHHYIRTIHTSFTVAHPHSSSAWAASAHRSGHSNVLLNIGVNANHYNTPSTYQSGMQGRRRSQAVSRPPRVQSASAAQIKFDPFADEPLTSAPLSSSSRLSPVLQNSTPRQHQPQSRVTHSGPIAPARRVPAPYTIQIPEAKQASAPQPVVKDKDARAKIVAGILLNRVHAVGKPMRRQEYVKSGLSRVVSVEA
ncbi:hypothetical protein BDQ17DRAFT_1345451 [Cyathus striatus]|nr:hypothetical protein BDQ17DRAFT_1345451 [Cyathus striatus]